MAKTAEPQKREVQGVKNYKDHPGGWDALKAVAKILKEEHVIAAGANALMHMNQVKGFDCPGCAWPDPKHSSAFDFCENGSKALAWEATAKRTTPEFFQAHTVSELWNWGDYELENEGRITHPMLYDKATDRYVTISWEDAFAKIAKELNGLASPNEAEFYTSGRSSNEAAFMFQLFARAYGTNNFPDCSNMCHEATSVGLPQSIGVGKGTVTLEDFDKCDAIFSFGHNPGTNHPRMMTTLHNAAHRGVPIVVINPLRERALEQFEAPQNPFEMVFHKAQPIAALYLQVKIGGDVALLTGMMKHIFERDVADIAAGGKGVLERDFIKQHTVGIEDLKASVEKATWDNLVEKSGIARADIEKAAEIYLKATKVIATYGVGITQHSNATSNVQQIANFLMLRGNMGRESAGICPLRGHSNVQGDRTVGITEKPDANLLAGMEKAFGFKPPSEHGHSAILAAKAFIAGKSKVLIALGGNYAVAMSDPKVLYPAMRNLEMAVYLSTKLNRSHLLTSKTTLILPVISRSEMDKQNDVQQGITVEDSMSMVHESRGWRKPASDQLRSEVAIIGGMARAALGKKYAIDWEGLVASNDLIRNKIAIVFPDFGDFNERIKEPGGFRLTVAASDRVWKTPDGKAHFIPDDSLNEDPVNTEPGHMTLTTLRSHDQYNTTLYGLDDRYRGIFGRRDILFMSDADLAENGLEHGDLVDIESLDVKTAKARADRVMKNITVVSYILPKGSIATYYPEANILIGIDHYDERCGTPGYKSVPVRVAKAKNPPVAKTAAV